MSYPLSFGNTLTGGIQDISALLTLIGTEQCEKHIGSALEGGYLYVAATVLSIFGSLGIVKAGIAVLIASVSIPKPSLFIKLFPDSSFSPGQRLLGARVLKNSGFQLPGKVSPKIGMDASRLRYVVETPLLEQLQDKYLSDADRLSVVSKSAKWNVRVILTTIAAAVISCVPYLHPFLNAPPSSMHTLWVFPFLRATGSSVVAVTVQFVIQSRITSIMKSRIIFMTINQLYSDDLGQLQMLDVQWDENLPAEECLQSLGHYLHTKSSANHSTRRQDALSEPRDLSVEETAEPDIAASCEINDLEKQLEKVDTSSELSEDPDDRIRYIRNALEAQYKRHLFTRDRMFFVASWIFLLLAIPATIVGYIGCFTLIANSGKQNGPLIWLGLEATLSILRILLWAWNPRFDEKTEVTVQLERSQHPPLVTTEKSAQVIHSTAGPKTLPIVPEHEFLQHITPYTGILHRFNGPENIILHYALTGRDTEAILCMTALNRDNQIAFTLFPRPSTGELSWYDTVVKTDTFTHGSQAVLRSELDENHLQRTTYPALFENLVRYHTFLWHALVQARLRDASSCNLRWKWSFLPIITAPEKSYDSGTSSYRLTLHDQLYLKRGYEHHLKTILMDNRGKWIVDGMAAIRRNAQNNCYHVLADPTSEETKRELDELEAWLLLEWTRSEWTILWSSIMLEANLSLRMKDYVEVVRQRKDKRLEKRLDSEFDIGWRKRLEGEKEQAKKRMDEARTAFNARFKGQPSSISLETKQRLDRGLILIDQMWAEVISGEGGPVEQQARGILVSMESVLVKQPEQRFGHSKSQRENERLAMEATVGRICDARVDQLDRAYQYPQSSRYLAAAIHSKFLHLGSSFLSAEDRAFAAKLSSAPVYNVAGCGIDIVRDVMQKSTTRSVIGVSKCLMKDIPDNNHLLYVNGPEAPKFIERNRERWWQQAEQRKVNSPIFYFSPQFVDPERLCAGNYQGTIARVMIFVSTPTSIQLRLVHCRIGQVSVSVSKPQANRTFCTILPDELSEDGLRLQDYSLGLFEPGRHELELLVEGDGRSGFYGLRDILVEFLNDPSSYPSDDRNDGRTGQTEEIEDAYSVHQ